MRIGGGESGGFAGVIIVALPAFAATKALAIFGALVGAEVAPALGAVLVDISGAMIAGTGQRAESTEKAV